MSDQSLETESGAVDLPTEQDTVDFGTKLAGQVRPGDVIALQGPLGAGKTTLARGFIHALTGAEEEVVSPTFTLVQTYDTPVGTVWHFDLYRLNDPEEVWELGLEEAMAGGITLIEWPERMGAHVLRGCLHVELSNDPKESRRTARISSPPEWQGRIKTVVDRAD